jgi:hypothetical protein
VLLLAANASERAAFDAVLPPDRLADDISRHLHEGGCELDGPIAVSVRYLRKPGPAWRPERSFHVEYERGDARPAPGEQKEDATVSHAELVVLKGAATQKVYPLAGARVNIGRLAEVTDRDDRVVRRNQVVFLDEDDETTRTVSRAQAHIRLVAPGEYRLHDDRSSHGTRIFRDGRTLEIPSGSPRGVRLRPGDEIYFGQASVRFEEARSRGARPKNRPPRS